MSGGKLEQVVGGWERPSAGQRAPRREGQEPGWVAEPVQPVTVGGVMDTHEESAPKVYSGLYCDMTISRPAAGVVLVTYSGPDVGEFGDAPFLELARDLSLEGPLEIFIDARETPAASIDVSGEWAQWMMAHRDRIHRFSMLCGSRFIELTAEFVQRFTHFGSRMRIYTEAEAFDEALRVAAGE